MADIIVETVKILGNALVTKAKFVRGVEGQVRRLRDELERMHSFLRDAGEKEFFDDRVRNWIADIRNIAVDTQDIIATFALESEASSGSSSGSMFRNCVCFPVRAYNRNSIGHEIEGILSRLEDVRRSQQTYGIRNLGEASSSSINQNPAFVAESRHRLVPGQQDEQVFGLEESIGKLLGEVILDRRPQLSFATIVGMGGIGKSCLARRIYNHGAISGEFDCRGWVCISSQLNVRDVIVELLLQFVKPAKRREILDVVEKETMPYLFQMLFECLHGKRYFIVIDDL